MSGNDENYDKIPGELAQALEQMSALVVDITEIMGTYYKELEKNGIPKELASALVMEYQRIILTGGKQ